jgi:hypothetical protein
LLIVTGEGELLGRVTCDQVIPSVDFMKVVPPMAANSVPVHSKSITDVSVTPVAWTQVIPSKEYMMPRPEAVMPAATITRSFVLIPLIADRIDCDAVV